MLKEYFQSVVGPISSTTLAYGPNGKSRGAATVEFRKPEHAALAVEQFNGVEVDSRPMTVGKIFHMISVGITTDSILQFEVVFDPSTPISFANRVG